MTYKDYEYEALQRRNRLDGYALVSPEAQQALAREMVPDAVLQQYYYQAILDWRGDLDAMGRGIYLYWDAAGQIIDVAGVPIDDQGFPSANRAPTARLLEDQGIPHQVAPYRLGGDQLADWPTTVAVMQQIADAARQWAKSMKVGLEKGAHE